MAEFNRLANAIRALSMDAVQAANSGHPGMPMGMADIATVLWREFHSHNPANPKWINRDRFVVSNGHGSMLPYSLLHLTGYDLPISELRNFRQLGSKTPGHPENFITDGIETTTGPLGQGLANAVGMALAEKVLARRFNRDGFDLVDHNTWVFLGDGCLMEGISHEACSLAGRLALGKLIAFYDDNNISIDGDVSGWFADDTPKRFEAYGWQVIADVDGHDEQSIRTAIEQATADPNRPTLICCKTVIGYGSPNKAGTAGSHGAALGEEEVAATREKIGWSYPPFEIPDDVYAAWDAREAGAKREAEWDQLLEKYQAAYPELAAEFQRRMAGQLPEDFLAKSSELLKQAQADGAEVASRKASQDALDAFGPMLPELLGGSADLAGSNNTLWKGSVDVNDNSENGNYVYFGVREFAMSAITNGMVLHSGFIPYSATFLVFSDYARNAVRMSALMSLPNIHVYTHDSIGLGEDGPTHQPVEHMASLRLIPNLEVWRPGDAVESMAAWQQALLQREAPSVLIFSRQKLAHQQRDDVQLGNIARGGYVLRDVDAPQAILITTGSELGLATKAADKLAGAGIGVRVVSMPCVERFMAQPQAYRDDVLPPSIKARVAIEAGVTAGWHGMVGDAGRVIGLDRFGASAPGDVLFEHFGFTVDNVEQTVRDVISG
jgi:transketolase